MLWSKNKKNRYTHAYPSFCYINVGYMGWTCYCETLSKGGLLACSKRKDHKEALLYLSTFEATGIQNQTNAHEPSMLI